MIERYSEALKQKFRIEGNTITFEDTTTYQMTEASALPKNREDLKSIHIVKKMFGGKVERLYTKS